MSTSPFHKGELVVQKQLGVEAHAARLGAALNAYIPGGAIAFIEAQSMLVISRLDKAAQIWVSIFFAKPGFVKVLDEQRLEINLSALLNRLDEMFLADIINQAAVGILFIDLATRRRLRVNGKASEQAGSLIIQVEQAYPNCPKYIQQRVQRRSDLKVSDKNTVESGSCLSADMKTWLAQVDTFFIGSSDGQNHLDVSHRGGKQGFIEVINDSKLKIPDYQGNNMFNTLGNLYINPRAGLLCVNFVAGEILHLVGKATIIWQDEQGKNTSNNTNRFWEYEISHWKKACLPATVSWELIESSPFNP